MSPFHSLCMSTSNGFHSGFKSWLLDISVMILACYVFHFTGFPHTCSLRVLSLAILGELSAPGDEKGDKKGDENEGEQENDDWTSYIEFCEFIAP